jgi:hypothetical protein
MSNTVRIFLGTRLECAQCHNHPFDRWTQMDYYKLAQFTYGVDTRSRGYGHEGVQELLDKDGKRRNKKYPLSGNARRALGDLLQPLSYGTSETNRQVKLPADYAYVEDGEKPPEVIAGVPFGEAPKGGRKESHREVYAKWLAGPENPRFTTVIANRMWKRALGFGLIEPVDDMKDTTVASNPELMTYLEGLMRNGNYDIKRFLRVVYNTRTYQREATVEDVPADKPYHFPGPLLRRMSAEQLWDSYVTLALPEPDGRKGNTGGRRGYAAKERVEQLRARDAEGILQQAIAVGAAEDKFQMENTRIREAQRVAQEAGDSEQLKALRKEMDVANKARREAINSANQMASSGMGSMSMMDMMAMEREKEMMEKKKAEAKKKGKKVANKPKTPWDGYGGHLMRASELPSPAPGGHFLREFGQSDRELIENSHQDTSVSQALSLLNGPVTRDVLNSKSVLKKAVAAGMSTDDKIDALFMSVLARKPSDQQREIAKAQLESNPKTGTDNLVWALVYTAYLDFFSYVY